jgi:hypothetical protein
VKKKVFFFSVFFKKCIIVFQETVNSPGICQLN